MSGFQHRTVLKEEAVTVLRPAPGRRVVDGTVGGGGHTEALLAAGADVLALDKDPAALEAVRARFPGCERLILEQASFDELPAVLERLGLPPVDGLLLDLGVSSHQLDTAERGFSFMREGPLDMRMGRDGPTAAELIAELSVGELASALRTLGEEPFAGPIARALKETLPQTTLAAVAAVERAVPRRAWPKGINVATKSFQALRILVNRELEALDALLDALPELLAPGGVAAIISFHSLEDRRVKQAFRALEGGCRCPPGLPVCGCGVRARGRVLTRRAISASADEVRENPRSRSARLRAVERLAA